MLARVIRISSEGLFNALEDVWVWTSWIAGPFIGLWVGLNNPDGFNPARVELAMWVIFFLYCFLSACLVTWQFWDWWVGKKTAG